MSLAASWEDNAPALIIAIFMVPSPARRVTETSTRRTALVPTRLSEGNRGPVAALGSRSREASG
jgi:hypothetical protein